MSVDTQYAYAVSRIRTIERKLLDKSGMERMAEAKSPEEALKIITEAGYGLAAGETPGVYAYEELLPEEKKKLYGLLKDIAPDPELFDIFLLQNDYHNLKVMAKAELSGQDHDEILIETGAVPLKKLKAMVKDRNMADMPAVMRNAVEECYDTFNRTGDPQTIDMIMDKAAFTHMRESAEASGNSFVKQLVGILIDLANIKVFLRVKKLNKSWDFLRKFLIPVGLTDPKLYMDHIDEPLDAFIDALRYKPYSSLAEGIESFKSTGTLTLFEKMSDNYVMDYVKKSRFVAFGIEPLVGYLVAKESEIRNIRIVMVGKINRISADIIRERLRETYV